jgi:hypothetical protein
MPEILEYRSGQAGPRPSSRGTLARAAMVAGIATAAGQAVAFGVAVLVGRPAWLILMSAIVLFAGWFITVVFGVVALLDRDGPRPLALAALVLAAGEAFLPLLIPLVR